MSDLSRRLMPARIWVSGVGAYSPGIHRTFFAVDIGHSGGCYPEYIRADLVKEAMEALTMLVDGKEIFDTQAADGSTIVVEHDRDLVEQRAAAAIARLKENTR